MAPSRTSLQRLFAPASVAVVGASTSPDKAGYQAVLALDGFPGEVFPINPKANEVLGHRAFASLGALARPVDLVLFADVLGFTVYCDRHPPEHVVANLDRLAAAFEAITNDHGLEKIKTVGDAFVATANLLEPHGDSVMACLGAASALAEAARRTPANWHMRIGIHLGPVVAGVVGSTKFSFDLWGDTVNVAQRLSAYGGEAAIYLSAIAWARVADRARGWPLGPVSIKGKGEIEIVRCEPWQL